MPQVTKAVFPVAGLGSRFLPATKASPKEMMPIVDKPLIQYAVEEALAAGITELIFVTGRSKRAIEDHFDQVPELEAVLESRGKMELLDAARQILPKNAHCIFIRQPEALGLGHAVLCAKPVIGDAPFAVILADDLIDAQPGVLSQMMIQHQRHGGSLIGVQHVAHEETSQYGVIECGKRLGKVVAIDSLVEKPRPADAPSTLAVVGRYILSPAILDHLASIQPGSGGEIQLTDGINKLLQAESVYGYEFDGTRYDCGSKLGYLKATVAYGLAHNETGEEFAQYLDELSATTPTGSMHEGFSGLYHQGKMRASPHKIAH